MVGSTSSISSNEGRSGNKATANPADGGRGYQLSTEAAVTPGGSQQSRTQSPTPPPSVMQNATAAASSNSPVSSSRNALGISHGWGVGLAHSGSYLATNVRMTSTIPLLAEEPDTYDAIKNILTKKKTWEQAQLEKTKAKQQASSSKKQNAVAEMRGTTTPEKREAAVLQLAKGKERLGQLILQRAELEKTIRSEWDEKMRKFENDSMLKEEEILNALKSKHEEEIKQMMEEVKAQNIAEEEELALKLSEMDEEKKRKIADATKNEGAPSSVHTTLATPSTPKRQKLIESAKVDGAPDSKTEEPGELNDELFGSPVKLASGEDKAEESDQELFGDSDHDNDKPLSVRKREELKKINDELKDLNKIKSQMVWLLKQVITAEAKLKLKQKVAKKSDK